MMSIFFLVIKNKKSLLVIGVETLARRAVFLFHVVSAAIASIPATSTVIVVVIAERIALICWFGTLAKTFTADLVGI